MSKIKKAKTLEEKRAALIIKYRGLKIDSKDVVDDKLVYKVSNENEKYIMHILMNKSTIGIAFLRELRKRVEEEEATGGIIVGDGKYTYSARSSAPELNIELIPPTLPTFDVFEHKLVPVHEIVSNEEKQKLVEKYHAEPYKFPWIKVTDPISIILGAKPGDVLRVTQKSETAGKYDSYRYVV
jgi:DNA-directed RNA polymerase subunit H (RpoH/RPB5)